MSKEHEQFLGEYKNEIKKKCYHKTTDKSVIDDVTQFVHIALIKAYKNRYKYKNRKGWSNVVKKIIIRRVIDFNKKHDNYRQRIVLIDNYSTPKPISHNKAIKNRLDDIRHVIDKNKNKFTELEIRYLDTVYEIYDSPIEINDDHIMYLMGYEDDNRAHLTEYKKICKSIFKKASDIYNV